MADGRAVKSESDDKDLPERSEDKVAQVTSEVDALKVNFSFRSNARNNANTISYKPDSYPTSSLAGNPDVELENYDALPNDEYYNMGHRRRGVALVFNHVNFATMSKRNGSDQDCAKISKILHALKFDVRVYKDLRVDEVLDRLSAVAAENHSSSDCLMVVMMSHGDKGVLIARDLSYPVELLWKPFMGNNCPTLAGKPKMFFIQACRGNKLDDGVKLKAHTQVDSAPITEITYSVPAMADLLVMYSTYEDYYAWRNPDDGAWFIQSLCAEFASNADKRDLLTMLTFVCRRVAIGYTSVVPHSKHFDKKKQIPSIVSQLTRLVYFGKYSHF